MAHGTEHWLPVAGYEGLYEVSDLGRVYSLIRGRMLKPWRSRGYAMVELYGRWGREGRTATTVSRLVLSAFDGPRPSDSEAMHGPGGKSDDRLCNLAWGTSQLNKDDRWGRLDRQAFWPDFEPQNLA